LGVLVGLRLAFSTPWSTIVFMTQPKWLRLLPILTGILIGTSYIPFPPWAIFFGLAPLFLFWTKAKSPWHAFFGGWISQFILTLIGFHWIAYTAVEFGHFPIWFGAFVLIGFASIAHLHYALAGLFGVWLSKRFSFGPIAQITLYALVFALCDHRFPMIFPWHLGYPWLWGNFPGAQFADVIGFEGLNIFTIMINACLALAIYAWSQPKKTVSYASVGLGISTIVILNLLGLGRADKWKTTDSEVNVLAVQGNIGNFDKLMAEKGDRFRDPIVDKYIRMTTEAIAQHPDADVVVWPETSFPSVLDAEFKNDMYASRVRAMVRQTQKPLLAGAYSYERSNKSTYNGFFFVDGTENMRPPYRKSILLVFGETFPFSDYIDYMSKLFPNQGSFGRGTGPTLMPITVAGGKNLNVGPQICYEGLYPWFSAKLAAGNAQIMVNVTNDSWFGKNFEPYQHMYMTLARAIEFRRPLVRATNTGITTAILASGEMLERSPIDQEWSGMFKIRYLADSPHTFYEKIAGQWGWALVISLISLVGLGRQRS
jgi:apolipoprotein N-acyltransferase